MDYEGRRRLPASQPDKQPSLQTSTIIPDPIPRPPNPTYLTALFHRMMMMFLVLITVLAPHIVFLFAMGNSPTVAKTPDGPPYSIQHAIGFTLIILHFFFLVIVLFTLWLRLHTQPMLARARVRSGFKRFEWVCTCGESMYADYPDTVSEYSLHLFRLQLERRSPMNYDLRSSYGSGQPHSYVGSASTANRTSLLSENIIEATLQETHRRSNRAPSVPYALSPRNDIASSIIGSSSGQQFNQKRHFELCVNENMLSIRLGEINLNQSSPITQTKEILTDAELFKKINNRYFDIRKRKWLTWFLKPVDIRFVRFHVFDKQRVGIFNEGTMSIPPIDEVISRRYHYYECPLEPAEPIDKRTFLHFFWNHGKHNHSPCDVWLNRMPKKLNGSLTEQATQRGPHIGWGVHIIEGPNKPVIALIFAGFIILSFVVSLVWALVNHTQESGFGIGQWMVAALTAGFTAFYFHITEA